MIRKGYGKYDSTTGLVSRTTNSDRCTNPRWTDGVAPSKLVSVTNSTIRKDTIIVPAGGYVRVWIVVGNQDTGSFIATSAPPNEGHALLSLSIMSSRANKTAFHRNKCGARF